MLIAVMFLPLPETLPIDDLSDANVLVHVGADLFPDQGDEIEKIHESSNCP